MEGLFFPIFFVIVFAFIFYITYINEQAKKREWQTFARANKLNFSPGKFLGPSTRVGGIYRNHHFVLDTFNKSHGKSSVTYTRITVWANPPKKEISSAPISTLGQAVSVGEITTRLTSMDITFPQNADLSLVEPRGKQFVYEQRGIETNASTLQRLFNFLSDVADNYPQVLALGGEAVPALQQLTNNKVKVLHSLSHQLLKDIGRETRLRLSPDADHLFCSRCLTACVPHQVSLSWWRSVTFYGCRTCSQSRQFLRGRLIAVLDQAMSGEQTEKDDVLVVNWLVRRELFDFSGIYINQANDEEVERFAVQIGNDTDKWRQHTYAQMRCLISDEAQLSENTLRILRRTFGAVVETEPEQAVTISNSPQSLARPIDNSELESSQFGQVSAR